jgi:hypothetical protein
VPAMRLALVVVLCFEGCARAPRKDEASPQAPMPACESTATADSAKTGEEPSAVRREEAPDRPLVMRIRDALQSLKNRSGEMVVIVDNVVRADVPYAGAAGLFLRTTISEALSGSPEFIEIAREEIDRITREQGFSLQDICDKKNLGNMPGKIRTAHALIKGSFIEDLQALHVSLSLVDLTTAQTRTKTLVIGKNEVPGARAGMGTNTGAMAERWRALQEGSLKKNDFFVRLALDRQSGAVYRIGEKPVMKFRAAEDCFLKVYHISDEGIHLLFPNRWHSQNFVAANTTILIPSDRMPFEYVITKPLGTEIIKAVACTEQFEDAEDVGTTSTSEAFAPVGDTTEENVRTLTTKGIRIEHRARKAEDTCLFTIVE